MLPAGLQTKQITGLFQNVYTDPNTGELKSRPLEGLVKISAAADRIIFEGTEYELYDHKNIVVPVENGRFSTELIVTDQPGINPIDWTYSISPSWKEDAINIPILSDGPEILDLNDYFNHPEFPGVIIQHGKDGTDGDDGIDGRGVVSFKIVDGTNRAEITYTDGTVDEIVLPILPEGGSIELNYVHDQSSPAAEWEIQHNLNRSISSVKVELNGETDVLTLCAWRENSLNSITLFVSDENNGVAAKQASGRAIVS